MLGLNTPPQVIASCDVKQFFQESLDTTMDRQGIETRPETVGYVADLLSAFARSERLYERTDEGVRAPVLAFLYGKANAAPSRGERCALMQRLGDVALFLSGFFADSFNRKLVDVDYCISMGEGAYGYLSEQPAPSAAAGKDVETFAELADKFSAIVEVLNEIGEQSRAGSDRDLMRLYERWLRTGSARIAQQLRAQGIEVSESKVSRAWH